jgi:hypothetical protein
MATRKKTNTSIATTEPENIVVEPDPVVESMEDVETETNNQDETNLPIGEFIALSVHEINTHDNARYGWLTHPHIYKDDIAKLEQSMLVHGYQKEHPISVFYQKGKYWIRDGHRRKAAAVLASEKKPLIPNMPQGYIWCILVEVPKTNLSDGISEYQSDNSDIALGIEQVNSNKSLARTPLDCAILIDRIYESIITKDGKAINKTAKNAIIESRLGLKPSTTKLYLQYFRYLDDTVKLWIQQSDISQDEDLVKLSFASITRIQNWVNTNYPDDKTVDDRFNKINHGLIEIAKQLKKSDFDENSKLIVQYAGGLSISVKAVCDLIEKKFPIEKKPETKVEKKPETTAPKNDNALNTGSDNKASNITSNDGFADKSDDKDETDIDSNDSYDSYEPDDSSDSNVINSNQSSTTDQTPVVNQSQAKTSTNSMIQSEIMRLVIDNTDFLIALLSDNKALSDNSIDTAFANKLLGKLEQYQKLNELEF